MLRSVTDLCFLKMPKVELSPSKKNALFAPLKAFQNFLFHLKSSFRSEYI